MIVGAVILAAGLSSRTFPDNKMMFRIDGKAIIEMTIDSLKDLCDHIVVVTGSRAEDITRLLGSSAKIQLVYNFDYEVGMYSSIKSGLKSVGADRTFILPGDCPVVSSSTLRLMLSKNSSIVIPSFNGQKGHPVLIDRNEANRILEDTINCSLRDYLISRPVAILPVEDPGILWDIDTVLDYEEMKSFLFKGGR